MSEKVTFRSSQRVPVSPEVVSILGNVSAAYMYAQLLYYDKYQRDSDGWFSKNSKELESDIGLRRRQQEHSRRLLEMKGWIETCSVRGGLKPTVRYRLLVRIEK